MTKTIDTAWRSYAEQVIPPHASMAQRMECRRAFYAGATAFYGALKNTLDPGIEPTDHDTAFFAAAVDELYDFASAVERGQA